MSRAKKVNLTDHKIRALKPPTDKDFIVVYDSQSKVGAKKYRSGLTSLIFRAKWSNVAIERVIDQFDPDLLIEEGMPTQIEIAREKARTRIKELKAYTGVNPKEAEKLDREKNAEAARLAIKKAEKNAIHLLTVGDVKKIFLEDSVLRPATVTGYRTCVKDWEDRLIAEITIADVREWHRLTSENSPISANRQMQYLRALINFIREKHADPVTGEYLFLPINVVTRAFKKVGKGQSWNAKGVSKTRIHKNKIGAVFNVLVQFSDRENNLPIVCTGADLILFLLLTGCRVGESRNLKWDNVDLDSDVPTFTLEADTVKTGDEVVLPISDALAIVLKRRLAARRYKSEFVFPAIRGTTGFISDPRKLFIKISAIAESHVTPHAMRRTFVDIARIVGVDSGERRILLNHKVARDVHDDNYENDDDPEALFSAVNKVGQWVTEQSEIAAGENVVEVDFAQ